MEDQVSAKRCGHRPGKEIVSKEEMVDRIKAAVDARHDEHFVIMARTDSLAVEGLNAAIDRAARAGEPSIDLTYHVPEAWAQACVVILDLMAEVDAWCRQGSLLTLAPPDDVVAYRRWVFGEFIRQVAGEPARPWSDDLLVADVSSTTGDPDADAG